MCGIVGAVAQRNVVPILIEGLKRLEYRGYDSAGLAVIEGGLKRVRSTGRVAQLEHCVREDDLQGRLGIAHTRWATHGAPTEDNAHPHVSHGCFAVVHNGIIENHESLRRRLRALGYVFTSQTDTEVIAHLVHHHHQSCGDLLEATQATVRELEGAYAIGVVCDDQPQRLICARKGSPLLIGLGIEENFIGSDISALLPVTQRMIYLEDGDVADVGLLSVRVFDADGRLAERLPQQSELSMEWAELGPHRHFMQKEIYEQPRALHDTLQVALAGSALSPEVFGNDAGAVFASVRSVNLLACGTSHHAARVAHYWIEELAGIPCRAEIASEYRYRVSVPDPDGLVVTISQSGETADTIAALQHARSLGHENTLAICNVPESALVRQSKLKFLTRAGPEIGVASTKAFTTQLAALFLLALCLAKARGRLSHEREREFLLALRRLPQDVQHVLQLESQVAAWAERFADKHHALFLGRGQHYPIALEGALKLKEISYIHAEAYPAGELKHGPLALVDKDMPVVAIAPNDTLLEKLKSNLQEVRARGGELYVLADADTHFTSDEDIRLIQMSGGDQAQVSQRLLASDEDIRLIQMSEHAGLLSPILHTIPLQLLAYHAALQKGTDVDKPRNLAKSVTVE